MILEISSNKEFQKRGWVFEGFLEKLGVILKGAHLKEMGDKSRLYQKEGGYHQALKDFEFFKPVYVRRNGDEMYGLFEKYEIRLLKYTGNRGDKSEPEALLVLTRKRNGNKLNEPSASRTIEYLPGGSRQYFENGRNN